MTRLYTLCLAVAFALLAAAPLNAARASELDKSLVPVQSKWLFHLDVDRIKASRIGKMIHDERDVQELRRRAAQVGVAWGIDPMTDIKSVTGFGPRYQDTHAAIVVEVDADLEQTQRMVQMAEQYELQAYGDFDIHTFIHDDKGKKKRSWVGVHEPLGRKTQLLIASEHRAYVTQTLDTIAGRNKSIAAATDSALATAPVNGAMMFVAAAGVKFEPEGRRPGARMWQSVDQLMMNLAEADGTTKLRLAVTTRTPEQAQNLHQIAQGMLALVKMSDDPAHAELATLAGAVTMSTTDTRVAAELAYPSERLFNLLKAAKESHGGLGPGPGHDDDDPTD